MATVMVVDDELEIRSMLEEVLNKEGHQVLTAQNATEAWGLLDQRPQAIFVDIDMGEESGVTFVSKLRGHPVCGRTPVTFVTAHPQRAKPLIHSGSGVVDVIVKPFRIELVKQRLAQMLKMPGAPQKGE